MRRGRVFRRRRREVMKEDWGGGGWNSPFLLTETHWLSFKAVQRGGVVVEDNDE